MGLKVGLLSSRDPDNPVLSGLLGESETFVRTTLSEGYLRSSKSCVKSIFVVFLFRIKKSNVLSIVVNFTWNECPNVLLIVNI